jgi:arabinofuranosyltransferase
MSDRPKWLEHAWIGVLLPFAWLVTRFHHRIDDAYISFRYARNWAEGAGLRYNPGDDPVEGFSNFLWVALLAVGDLLGASPEHASIALGVLSSLTLVFLLHRFTASELALPPLASFAGVLFLVTFPPFAVWTTGGLETSLFALALFGAWTELVRPSGARPRRAVAWALAIATLRPEGFIWALGLALAASIALPERESRRAMWARYLPPLTAALVILFVARWFTFGDLLPNTARAKGELSSEVLFRGARCVASYFLIFLSPCLILALAPFALRGRHQRLLASALVVFLAGLSWCTVVGGDWMAFFRFLAPLTPFLALLLAGALRSFAPPRALALLAGTVVFSLLPAFDLHLVPRAAREACSFRAFRKGYETELQRFRSSEENLEQFILIGRALAEVAAEGDSLVFGAIGAVGYYSGLVIHDRNGLVDREVAGLEVSGVRSAGHDKRVARVFFAPRRPTFYDAVFVPRAVGPEGFRKIAGSLIRRVTGEEREERALFRLSIPEAIAVRGDGEEVVAGTLVVWRGTTSPEEARTAWAEIGVEVEAR